MKGAFYFAPGVVVGYRRRRRWMARPVRSNWMDRPIRNALVLAWAVLPVSLAAGIAVARGWL